MLTYAVFYGFFSAFAVLDNVQEHYPVPFTIWSVIYYLLVLTGNLIYSLDAITLPVRKIWKSVFPIIIAGYFLGSAIDLSYGKYAHRLTISLIIIGL